MDIHRKIKKDGGIIPARYIQSSSVKSAIFFLKRIRKGSMTVETAIVLPLFLFAVFSLFQFASLQIASSALLAGMHETAKEMAVYAYVQDIGISAGDSLAADLVAGGLSAAYAKSKIEESAGLAAGDGKFSLLQSSFLVNEMIDVVGSYQSNHTFTIFPVKKIKTIMRARVRAWTGREGRPKGSSDQTETTEGEEEEKGPKVYVTETGKVYHKDPNCTHIHLSVSTVSKTSVDGMRNMYGAKYHSCEKCGAAAGSEVYIAKQGNRYHSSLECSGLKRTVQEYYLSDVEGMRACSRCGGN